MPLQLTVMMALKTNKGAVMLVVELRYVEAHIEPEVTPIRFEDELAWYGLDLADLTFNEIIKGDLAEVLKARGIRPLSNYPKQQRRSE